MKTPVLESYFNLVAVLKTGSFIIKRFQHRCFPVNISTFVRTAFFIEHLRLLLPLSFSTFTIVQMSIFCIDGRCKFVKRNFRLAFLKQTTLTHLSHLEIAKQCYLTNFVDSMEKSCYHVFYRK